MAKKTGSRSWPGWLAVFFIFAWVIGDDDQPSDRGASRPSPSSFETTASIPTDRTVTRQRETAVSITPTTPKSTKPETRRVVAVPSQSKRTMFVDASRLNVRSGAGKNHKVIWTVKRDEAVSVTHTEGEWSHIEGSRYRGWVFSSYLTPRRSPPKQRSTVSTRQQQSQSARLTTSQVKKLLIRRSHAYYNGNCPCPYNRDRAGRRCGKRSAYSRPGGASPLCYEGDVSEQMVANFRARQ